MEKEALAHIGLTKFKDHSRVEMEGSVGDLFSLTATLVHRLAKGLDKSPRDVLMEINRSITLVQIFEILEGVTTHDE